MCPADGVQVGALAMAAGKFTPSVAPRFIILSQDSCIGACIQVSMLVRARFLEHSVVKMSSHNVGGWQQATQTEQTQFV